VDGYTRAIQLDPSNKVYFANRAFSHTRLENFGAAAEDATRSLELDPSYAKAYYRRADAAFARAHFREAVADFRAAARLAPRDPDLRRKLSEAERELKRVRFEDALSLPENTTSALDDLNLDDYPLDPGYSGPAMEEDGEGGLVLTLDFVRAMMEEFRAQRMPPKRFVYHIVRAAADVMRALPSLVDVDVPAGAHITVRGDTHGQFYDLLHIFELNGLPSDDNPYLFNGDFVDRGSFSVEVILTLLAFKALCPGGMHLTRGNHESRSMNALYGAYGEMRAKLGSSSVELFRETFCTMPLAYVLGGRVMVVHGGIPTCAGGDLESLRRLDRRREPPDEGPMCECLWNDPQEEDGLTPNKRGVGQAWGPDVTRAYLAANGLSLVVRSHEVKDEGYEVAHGGYVVTIFSAPRYCDQMTNRGAFITFNGGEMVPHFTQFDASPHPENVRAMQYATGMMGGMMGY
jgi:serine/threonine-protein phosphatase 5